MKYPKGVLSFILGEPRFEVVPYFHIMATRNILTHLQKYSYFGFMITWPFCFHFWLFYKKQETDRYGTWIPGSEQGIYFRTPGYRWDADLGMIWTWGYFGGHWD